MLEDLVVTREEYELAHENFFECMRLSGWDGQPELSPDGILFSLTFFVGPSSEFDADMARCERQHLIDAARVYQAGLLVLSDTDREEALAELDRCLRRNGVADFDLGWSDGELADHLATTNAPQGAWACRETALRQLGADR